MSSKFQHVEQIIKTEIKDFSEQFFKDYCSKKGKKKLNIENKKNNIFIAALGKEVMVYSTLMRSLDSSLGNRIEKIAKLIAEKNYIVRQKVEGQISQKSIRAIASLLESYKSLSRRPKDSDIESIYKESGGSKKSKREFTDYYLTLKSDISKKFLIELKIGGDLDNKKARSEKEALLEQYVILRHSREIEPDDKVKILFCTAYNKYGEGQDWKQSRVRQFFSSSEIKIGKDFWDFFCNSPKGYETVKASYLKHSHFLKDALKKIIAHHS